MKHFRRIALAALTGCVGLVLAPTAHADVWNKKTILTVTETIQMPSCCTPDHTVTLPPGKYVMVLVDSLADRHIVRVFAEDEKTVITTVLAIPNYRLQPTGKTVLQYWEVPAGQPKSLRAWFYPGDNFGQEFAYPKQTALQIAALVKSPVPAIEAETSAVEDLKTAPLVVVDETGKTAQLEQALPMRAPDPAVQLTPQLASQTTPDAAPQATAEPAPPAAQPVAIQGAPVEPQTSARTVATETSPTRQTLPETASLLPLVGLAGLVSLALFAALGANSRRRRRCKV